MSENTEKPYQMSALILAAGMGTRMKSEKAKVLHEVFFAPMIHHVLDAVQPLFERIFVVIGHQGAYVRDSLRKYHVQFAEQKQQLGTAHAVLAAEEHLLKAGGVVMILCGDTPLVRSETLRLMVEEHLRSGSKITVMTTNLDNPANYGRIVTDGQGRLKRIVEEKDATPEQRQISEVNAGIYCAETRFLLEFLREVKSDNKQGEYYLTDLVEIAGRRGESVHRFFCSDAGEVLGVNSRHELAQAHLGLQLRRNNELMNAGVTLLQPESIFVEKEVIVGNDTVLGTGVQLHGKTRIGKNCKVGPFTIIRDAVIGDGASIGAFSHLTGATVNNGDTIPPQTFIALQKSRE
jgi:bifunctional UDP-N-acetylglucosamine pyrophosphorylase / glucosamine-1-phosphate N-acetyltransferase